MSRNRLDRIKFISPRAYRYNRHLGLCIFLNETDEFGQVFWQFGIGFRRTDIGFPALMILIHWFDIIREIGRYFRMRLSIQLVLIAITDFIKMIHDIDFGYTELSDAIEHTRISKCWKIDPSTSSRSSCRRAEFGAFFSYFFSDFIVQFCREGSRTDSRAIRLGDSVDFFDFLRGRLRVQCILLPKWYSRKSHKDRYHSRCLA